MKTLIVNADDFGLHSLVNQAILQGHLHGCITSASLMPTGAAFDEAVEFGLRAASLDVGVHLTLVAGRPVLKPDHVRSLVDANGFFFPEHISFIRAYAGGKIRMEEVYRELSAQIERALHSGVRITHLDSHQHLHVLPALTDLCIDLAQKYGIRAMRIPSEPYGFSGGFRSDLKRWIGKCGLTFLSSQARAKARRNGIAVPSHFFGMLAGGHMSKSYLIGAIASLPDGCSEIMMHPGSDSAAMRDRFGWDYCWEDELAAVLDADTLRILHDRHVKLSSFGELSHE